MMNDFSSVLKDLRRKKGLSQEALAKMIHVSRSAIAKYENGLGLPSDDVIEALCQYFNIGRDDLFPKHDLVNIIVNKNKRIRLQSIGLITLISLLVLGATTIGIIDYVNRMSAPGGMLVVNGQLLAELPSDSPKYFSSNDYEFGYRNTYKNERNDFILQPSGEIWSVNGIPDIFMGFYNDNDISLYLFTTPNDIVKLENGTIADNGKYCFNTFGYGGYNFLIVNESGEDVNIRQLEFWC